MNNKIILPETHEIDFNEVGLTGQAHDNYAEPGTNPRYDWMRIVVLGLLANQSSSNIPTEFRPGTLWYDLATFFFKCAWNGYFVDVSKHIEADSTSLHNWAKSIDEDLARFIPSGSFSGIAHNKSIVINIPKQIQHLAVAPNKPFLYKNGKMVPPNLINFNVGCPVCIELTGEAILAQGDQFVVFIQ